MITLAIVPLVVALLSASDLELDLGSSTTSSLVTVPLSVTIVSAQ